jgi:hypothetical protein
MPRLACALVLLCASAALADPGTGRRWAVVIGENRGLPGEEPLRFAEDDARRVLEVFAEVGGVEPALSLSLLGADAAVVRAALERFRVRLSREAGPGDRLVVYASAHGGEGALHLDGTELPLSELVDFVRAAPVGVGLLVVDSCRSGALTRTKGLKPVEGEAARGARTVEATLLEGRVLITASGADEYAQESDALGGSYFTHHFLTGLRGAADRSNDGRVTLDEAYAWAYARTLESTFASRGGLQRPAFKVDLRGQGELVLSEPGAAKGRLTLAVEAPGSFLVIHAGSGSVFAEVDKGAGPATLALPPGKYRLRQRADAGWLEREVTVPVSGGVALRLVDFEQAPLVKVALKGASTAELVVLAGGAVSSGLVAGVGAQPGLAAALRRDGHLAGPLNQLTLDVSAREGWGVGSALRQTELELSAGAGHRWLWGRASLALGLDLGALLVFQSGLPDGSRRTGLAPTALAGLELRVKVSGPVELFVSARGGLALVKKLAGVFAVPRGAGSLGVAFTL